jgi:REP element-mobilizing transposase RayT
MPRLARLDTPGVVNHIIIRGIERRKIFRDNKDKDSFLDRLDTLLPQTKTACYAWALLSNHAHFLFRTGDTPLSTLMRRLLTGHAVSFNRRHKRHGQLFQNRYKSIICQEDAYLKELVRYIHLNPLRAKIVSDISELNTYAYCGHSAIMNKKKRSWQDIGYVLSYFGKSLREARKRYRQYVESGIEEGRRPELVGGGLIRSMGGWKAVKGARLSGQDRMKGDHRILGDSAFVMEVLAEAEEKFERFYELKSKGYDLDTVVQKVCRIFGVEPDEIYSKSRQKIRAEARGLYCYWAVVELGYSLADLARLLGMTGQGVGYAVRRGERIAKANNYRLIE